MRRAAARARSSCGRPRCASRVSDSPSPSGANAVSTARESDRAPRKLVQPLQLRWRDERREFLREDLVVVDDAGRGSDGPPIVALDLDQARSAREALRQRRRRRSAPCLAQTSEETKGEARPLEHLDVILRSDDASSRSPSSERRRAPPPRGDRCRESFGPAASPRRRSCGGTGAGGSSDCRRSSRGAHCTSSTPSPGEDDVAGAWPPLPKTVSGLAARYDLCGAESGARRSARPRVCACIRTRYPPRPSAGGAMSSCSTHPLIGGFAGTPSAAPRLAAADERATCGKAWGHGLSLRKHSNGRTRRPSAVRMIAGASAGA